MPREWLNRTVLGVGLASLLSDWSHEVATTAMPAFLATMGVAAAWVGIIEGVSDGISSFAKMGSGYYTDRLKRRKPIAVLGYVVTALGTASFGLATRAWHVLLARSVAWLGRGVRTPVRKALLTSSVGPTAYGRALGFERMMDTIGAIAGPGSAFLLLHYLHVSYSTLFALTLIPGLLAAACIAFLVQERSRPPIKYVPLGESLRHFERPYRRFLVAVGVFGVGDFSHTLLILFATQQLTPHLGPVLAASTAVGLYVVHNVVNAGAALLTGWMSDHMEKRKVVFIGYVTAAIMAAGLILSPPSVAAYAFLFSLAGFYTAVQDTAEDALAAELVHEDSHGMAFGTLATVNGIGDMVSSSVVGLLWTAFGAQVAFGYSGLLYVAGALLVRRV